MYDKIIDALWNSQRDLLSDGYNDAIDYLAELLPGCNRVIFPSGTRVANWTVPSKWTIKNAYIKNNTTGEKIINWRRNGLSVMSYSIPVDIKHATWGEIRDHIFTSDNGVPFKFSYYKDDWGFCCTHDLKHDLEVRHSNDDYSVKIKSELVPDFLSVLQYVIPGDRKEEILIMAHLDHPYQVNDGLSGVAALVDIATVLSKEKNKYTYRFWILPETIGSLCMLDGCYGDNVVVAIFLDMLGINGPLVVQSPPNPIDEFDEAVQAAPLPLFSVNNLAYIGNDDRVLNFAGIPCYSINRVSNLDNPFGYPYPDYHTDRDCYYNRQSMEDAIDATVSIVNQFSLNLDTYVECISSVMPCLSSIGMYEFMSATFSALEKEQILYYCQTKKSMYDITQRFGKKRQHMESLMSEFAKRGIVRLLYA
jgi:aminopeptidase-like protein